MSENETSLELDTRREKPQKIHKSNTDLQNLGTLTNEETKPTILPPQPPQTPDPTTTSAAGPILYDETNFHDISD